MLGKIACFAGFHDWGYWSQKKTGSCAVTRFCNRQDCNAKETTYDHDWNEWIYDHEGACDQTRICKWCNEKDNRIAPHKWGEWVYESPDSCKLIRYCKRCHLQDEEQKEADHKMRPWFQPDPHIQPCLWIRECERCGFSNPYEDKQERHHWGSLRSTTHPCVQEAECDNCGLIKRQLNHQWNEWEEVAFVQPDGTTTYKKQHSCKQCGEKQTKSGLF